jgi:hypothetical protein
MLNGPGTPGVFVRGRSAASFAQKFLSAKTRVPLLAGVAILLALPSQGRASQLIVNGGFETGSLAGWTETDQAGGAGSWYLSSATHSPVSNEPTPGPAGGTYYAVTDQGGPGTHILTQSFTVPTNSNVTVSFDMFVNDWDGGPYINPAGLNYETGPNEQARVDILTAGANAFDTGLGVLYNVYEGADSPIDTSHPYSHYSLNLSFLLGGGGTYQIRFAEVDNQGFFNMGVDDVSIVATPMSSTPEPASLTIAAIAISVCGVGRLRARRLSEAQRS